MSAPDPAPAARRERAGGTAMIAGALMTLVTMAFHPTGHDVARGQGALNVAVHALAIASVPIAFYGGFALTRRLARAGSLAELALAFYGISALAALVAATASGFLATELIRSLTGLEGAARDATRTQIHYNFALNQAFARVLVAASSVAIGLWSVAILRTRLLGRPAGILGCAVAVLVLGALFSGQLRLDVHGFGAVVLAQSFWLIVAGLELRAAS